MRRGADGSAYGGAVHTPGERAGPRWAQPLRSAPLTVLAIGALTLLLSTTVVLSSDSLWLAVLGDHILRTGSIPDGLPFAAAPTAGWTNVPVLAELVVALTHRAGDLGLAILQLVADLLAWSVLAGAVRRRSPRTTDGAVAVVLVAMVAGSLADWGVVRMQLLSLVPFAVMLWLLAAEHRQPSRRVWWLPALVALWGNLHGAVLIGVSVIGAYLLLSRLRREPATALAVGALSVLALGLNPALARTPGYYLGVLTNEAARTRTQLWSAPDPTSILGVLLVVVAVVLFALAIAGRPAGWEWVAIAGLAAGTATNARTGVWLLMVLSLPAAAGLARLTARRRTSGRPEAGTSPLRPMLAVTGVLMVLAGPAVLATRSSSLSPVDPAVVQLVSRYAQGQVVLAPEPLAEWLAADGLTVWASDPIDAFSPADQRAYLAFVGGQGSWARAADGSGVVVLGPGGPTGGGWLGGFRVAVTAHGWTILTRG